MTHTEEIVAALCLYGKQTATQLRNVTGLDHAAVYAALIWLDAQGRAIMVRRKWGNSRPQNLWVLA
ncbi:hypothetical protein [Polaromonas sp. YR568]|uniref:hypothetical protein n=1 Tax=Polaromonas sp. YR568 TaxID=1855301 RepID=UPI0031381CA2